MTLTALTNPALSDADLLNPRPERQRPQNRSRRSPHHRRVWAQEASAAVAANRVRLQAIRSRGDYQPIPRPEAEKLCVGIESLLARANNAVHGVEPGHTWFVSWWRGNCIEAAFQNLHRAEAEMVRLYSDHEVDAEIPEAVARAELGLNRDDPRHAAARRLPCMKDAAAKRITLSKTVQIGHEAADRLHSRVRVFRNIVLVAAMLLALFVLLFVIWVAGRPGTLPLCFTTPDAVTHCPGGPGMSSAADVQVVTLLGLLGGALAAAVSIRNIKGNSAPYNIAVALALLKFPAGALTALGALIAIGGQLVPGLTALDTQPQILAYALLFGYAQQLLTGLIDKRAMNLLDSVPSKDPAQDRHQLNSNNII
jgi:hypothetical protein